MKPVFLKYSGHFLAGCMDFAAGVLIVAVLGAVLNVEVPLWMYPLGAFLAVLPDMDIILDVLRASDLLGFDHHQTIMHRPILILPAVALFGAVLGFFFGNFIFYILASVLCVFWHYIHDTKGVVPEGGIAWAWPLSKLYWGFRGGEKPEDVRHRDTPFYLEWIKPTSLSVRELSFVVILLTAASFFDIRLSLYASYLLPLFIAAILALWVYTGAAKKPL